jgi:hypothetical protein
MTDIIKRVPPPASEQEVSAGIVANKYVSPFTLKNFKGTEGFFLSARGDFGNGGAWADSGFLSLFPVVRYDDNNTERAVFMFYGISKADFSTIDPVVAFIIYSTGAPTVGEAVRWSLSTKYKAEGEQITGASDEIILQTQVLTSLSGNTRQTNLEFTLDRTLISNQDVVFLNLERIGGDVLDTYGSDIAVGQSGILIETTINNP